MTLVREEWKVPDFMPFGDTVVVPYKAGGNLNWRLQTDEPAPWDVPPPCPVCV